VVTVAPMIDDKLLVLLQVNCRSIHNKVSDFWNLIDPYNPDVVIGTESWLSEEISNAEVFRNDYTTFRRDIHICGGGVFICVRNYITCTSLWVKKVYEMIAVDVKGRAPKITWEIVGIHRAPNEDMQLLEKLTDRTGYMGRTTKCSIIGGDHNLPYAEWNGRMEKSRGGGVQVFLNRLVRENGYTQLVNSPTRGDALLDVYVVRPERAFTSCSNVQGISDHYSVLLEAEWGENCCEHQVERLVPVYQKTKVTGLQSFLRGKFASWASNGRCVKEIWKHFQETVPESIDCFVPHKILRKNPDPEYYNKKVKQLLR